MMKLNVIYLFKKKRFQLRFKKINIRTSSDFKGELVPKKSGLYRKKKDTLEAKERTSNKRNPHMASMPAFWA